jgi:putative membrane protein
MSLAEKLVERHGVACSHGPPRPGLSGSRPVSDQASGSHAGDGARSQQEDEPDVRFTYANERTFLAWNRTALALIATGVAATQLLPKLQVEWGRRLLGLPLIALGALVAAESFRQWRANERAMRRGDPLPRSWMPLVLTIGIVVIGAIAVVIAAFGTR